MQLRTKTPIPKRAVVDYLSFVLPWACDPLGNHKAMYDRARQRITSEFEDGSCTGSFAKPGRYRFVFAVPLPGGSKATVRIGARDPARQKGGISVALNPAKFQSGDAERFHEVMSRIIGRSYTSLLRHALINRIDFAVDILHAHLDRMLVSYQHAQKSTVFGKSASQGAIETYNFGSESSDYMTAVYEKNIERRHRAVLNIAKHGLRRESLKTNFVKQLEQLHNSPPVVRVEVRGKKLRGISLSALAQQENRFARFTLADLDAAGKALPKKLEEAFMSLCRDRGVRAALEHYKGTPDVRKVNAFWRSHRADWWKPERMMEQACAALRSSGIFPLEAFAPSSNERDAPPLKVPRSRTGPTAFASDDVKFKRTGPVLERRREVVRIGLERTEPRRDRCGRISSRRHAR